jgi:nucleotide-binding universal stress UspA family protein
VNVRTAARPSDLDTTRSFPVPTSTMKGWLEDTGGGDGEKPSVGDVVIEQHQIDASSPAETIVDYVEDHGVDLVVMGTHGRQGLDRARFGSVAEEVVRTAPAPVLTVRAHAPATTRPVRRILAPIDFSEASETALRHAKEIALTYGAEIDLLHVIDRPSYPSAYGLDSLDFSGETVLENAENGLADLAEEIVGHEHAKAEVVYGHPVAGILDYIEDNEIDLLVIATRGRTGLSRLLLGSVAERVLRQSPIPVFLVKPERASLLSASSDGRVEAESS